MTESDRIENRIFAEIEIGDSASQSRTLTKQEIEVFAIASGDANPAHLDEDFPGFVSQEGVIGHGMWTGGLISGVLGMQLPGPGAVYRGQDLEFRRPVHLGDTVTVRVTAKEKRPEESLILFDCRVVNQKDEEIAVGTARVIAPTERISWRRATLPKFGLLRHEGYDRLIESCREIPPVVTSVAHPCDVSSLKGALDAAAAKLIEPILVGPEARIRAVAEEIGADLDAFRVISTEHSHASAAEAVRLARVGEAEAVMKGSLHSDELLSAVAKRETGLRTERRLSHCFVMDVSTYEQPLIITDAAINIYPTLEDKRDICQNAIDLALALDFEEPRVAILSAVETVTPKIPGTLDAAALCKMADRGQITGGVLDGPLAFDNAISVEAAKTKGIHSPVAGRANILLVPDLEAGNMLAKQLTFLAHADAAGIVLGARVPIMLTSRADNVRSRMASSAVALRLAQARRAGERPGVAAE